MPEFIVKPATLKALWKILPSLPAGRKYLAGGTDLVNALSSGKDGSACWVDISAIGELRAIKETKKTVFIGAGATISEIENSSAARRWAPALAACIPHFASPSLRNMATIGGNAANASPCADGVCALISERAAVRLEVRGKKRKIPLSKLFLGPKTTALRKDEIILGFEIPKWRHAASYQKLGPRAYFGISKAAAAVSAEIRSGAVAEAHIALASVGPIPVYAAKTSAFLKGRRLDAEVIAKAAEIAKTEVSPITDVRSGADYRRQMCGVLVARALRALR